MTTQRRRLRPLEERSAMLAHMERKQMAREVRLSILHDSLTKAKHRERSRRKYEIGGLAVMAEAEHLDNETIAGMFLFITDNGDLGEELNKYRLDVLTWCKKVGARFIAIEAENARLDAAEKLRANPPAALQATFAEAPSSALQVAMKRLGIRFNPTSDRWEGRVPKSKIGRIAGKITLEGGRVALNQDVIAEFGLDAGQLDSSPP